MAAAVALAVAVAVLPPKLALLLAIGVPAALAVAVRPRLLVYALPLTIPFAYRFALPVGGTRIGLVDLALAGGLAAFLARSVANRELGLRWGALGWALALWVWVTVLTLTVATSMTAGLAESIKWGEVLLVYLLVLALLRIEDARWLVYGIGAAGTLSALIGLYQFATGSGPAWFVLFGRYMRAYGTFEQPNPFAGHLGLSLPYALAWAVSAKRPRWERLAMLGASGVMALGILASWSRGGWLALVVSLALMGVLLSRRLALAMGALALVALLFFGDLSGTLVSQRLLGMGGDVQSLNVSRVEPTDANFSVVERLAHWQAGWYMFAAHPWLGVGIGNYEAAYPRFALPRWPEPLGHAHNFYLNVAAETGLIGLMAFATLGVAASLVLLRAWRRSDHTWKRPLLLAVAGSLAYLSIHNLVDNLFVHGMHVLVGLGLGLAALVAADSGGYGGRWEQ